MVCCQLAEEHTHTQLTGQVDECCCDVETVDTLNREKIYPLISSLMKETYFRFFKVRRSWYENLKMRGRVLVRDLTHNRW